MNESHFLGLLLVHQKIDGLALVAEFTLRVGNLCIDIYQIPYLLRDFCPYCQNGSVVGTALRNFTFSCTV